MTGLGQIGQGFAERPGASIKYCVPGIRVAALRDVVGQAGKNRSGKACHLRSLAEDDPAGSDCRVKERASIGR